MQIDRLNVAVFLALGSLACAADQQGQHAAAAVNVPLLSYSTRSEEARQHVQAGERLWDTGYNIKANQEFKRAAAADSSFGYAYLRISQSSTSLDEYTVNVRRAVAHEASATPVERLLIDAEQKNVDNDNRAAVELLKQATVLEPKNARVWFALATGYLGLADATGARPTLEKVIALDSSYGNAYLALGSSYTSYEPKDLAKAEHYMLAGQQRWPKEPITFFQLGGLRRTQGRLDDAIAAYTQLITLVPEDAQAYRVRGHANTFAGHADAAKADYDNALRVAKPSERTSIGINRASVDAYAGNVDGTLAALAELRRALPGLNVATLGEDDYTVLDAIFGIALVQRRLPLADSTMQDMSPLLRRLAEKNGAHGYVTYAGGQIAQNEGFLAAARGDFATARGKAAAIRSIRQGETDPTKDTQEHGLLGYIALAEKNYALADSEFRRADPNNAFMNIQYWRALAAEGRRDTAQERDILQKIATYNFNQPAYIGVRYDAMQKLKALK